MTLSIHQHEKGYEYINNTIRGNMTNCEKKYKVLFKIALNINCFTFLIFYADHKKIQPQLNNLLL